MNNRYIGALLISPFLYLFFGDYYLAAFIMVISLIAMREFYNSIKTKTLNPQLLYAMLHQ